MLTFLKLTAHMRINYAREQKKYESPDLFFQSSFYMIEIAIGQIEIILDKILYDVW